MRLTNLLLLAASATLSGIAGAQSLPADLLACREIAGADERLACYDRAVDRRADEAGEPAASAPPRATTTPSSDRAETAPSAPAATVPVPGTNTETDTDPMPSPEALFGRDPAEIQRRVDQASGREELQQITAGVVELIEIAPDRIAVKLDNGQTWRQTVAGRFFLREGHEVEIRRATLGSYLMSRAGSNRSIRVERAD